MNAVKQGPLERGTGVVLVVALHVALIYAFAVGLGVARLPTFVQPMQAVIINAPDKPQWKPPVVKPNLSQPNLDVAPTVPEIPIDVPVDTAPPPDSQVSSETMEASNLKVERRTEPVYPAASRRAGEEGTTVLRVLVDEHGRAGDVSVVQSSGFPRLDQSAVDAIRRWTFAAATNGSQAVRAYTTVRVRFRLDR